MGDFICCIKWTAKSSESYPSFLFYVVNLLQCYFYCCVWMEASSGRAPLLVISVNTTAKTFSFLCFGTSLCKLHWYFYVFHYLNPCIDHLFRIKYLKCILFFIFTIFFNHYFIIFFHLLWCICRGFVRSCNNLIYCQKGKGCINLLHFYLLPYY